MNVINARMIFDGPAGPWPSDYRDEDYFAVTLEVDPGTPGSRENEEYNRHEIRTTFHEGTEEEKFWKSLGPGDEVQMLVQESAKARSGYSFKPIVPNDWEEPKTPQQATEQYEGGGGYNKASYQSPKQTSSGRTELDWMNTDHADAVVQVGKAINEVVSRIMRHAESLEWSPEIAQKLGVTSFIEAKGYVKKQGPAGFIEVVEEVNQEETIIRGIDPDGLPGSFLNACSVASKFIDGRDEAAAILKRFGFGRDDLDPNDPDGWVFLYTVARAFAYATKEEGLPEQEAEEKVINAFDLDVNVEPF